MFIDLLGDDDYFYLENLYRSIRNWGWNQALAIEIEVILRYYLLQPQGIRVVHDVSEEAYQIIDGLSPVTLLRESRKIHDYSIQYILEFLRDRSLRSTRESRLRKGLIMLVLEDQARELPLIYLGEVIEHLKLNNTDDKQLFETGTCNWDIQELHDILLNMERGWLCYFIDRLTLEMKNKCRRLSKCSLVTGIFVDTEFI